MDIKIFIKKAGGEFVAEFVKDGDDVYTLTHLLVPMMTGQQDANGQPSVSLVPYSLFGSDTELEFDRDEFRAVTDAPSWLQDRYQAMFGKIEIASLSDMDSVKNSL